MRIPAKTRCGRKRSSQRQLCLFGRRKRRQLSSPPVMGSHMTMMGHPKPVAHRTTVPPSTEMGQLPVWPMGVTGLLPPWANLILLPFLLLPNRTKNKTTNYYSVEYFARCIRQLLSRYYPATIPLVSSYYPLSLSRLLPVARILPSLRSLILSLISSFVPTPTVKHLRCSLPINNHQDAPAITVARLHK
jgi:hypothetical protein